MSGEIASNQLGEIIAICFDSYVKYSIYANKIRVDGR